MESDLFNGALPFPVNFTTIAIGLVILLALIAFVRGVIGMLVGILCLLAGAFVGYWCHSLIPGWISIFTEQPSPRFAFFAALGIGVSVYICLRLMVGAFLLAPIRKKREGRLLGGIFGAALSLIPAAVVIFVLGLGFWMAGVIFSIDNTDTGVAVKEGEVVTERPFWARWNEALDRDYVASLIAKVDPVAVRAKGVLLNLMVALKDNAAGGKLSEDPAAGKVLRNVKVRELDKDPEITKLVEKGDYTRLINHPKVREVAADREVSGLLEDVHVEKAVDSSLYAVEKSGNRVRRTRSMRFSLR